MSPALVGGLRAFIEGRPSVSVLEYGSGHSTPFWLSLSTVDSLVSVENDAEWFRAVKQWAQPYSKAHDYILCDTPARGSPGKIEWLDREKWGRYRLAALRFLETSAFDLIISDGHDRCDVAAFYISALKPDGILLVHDLGISDFRVLDEYPGSLRVSYLSCDGQGDQFRGNQFLAFSRSEQTLISFLANFEKFARSISPSRLIQSEITTGLERIPAYRV